MQKFTNVLKMYNERGLFQAITAMFDTSAGEEKTVRIHSHDSPLFHAIEKRLARARLIRSANPASSISEEFGECLIPFTNAMTGCHEYLAANKPTKSKHYAVYLTYYDTVETSNSFCLTIKSLSTGNTILISVITGVH